MAEQKKKIGKYDIIEIVGSGDMGTVYKAKDPRLNRFVAIKVISPDGKITEDLRTRFFAEAQTNIGLTHPNIAAIHDVDEEGDLLYAVMELLDGQDLKRLIADKADVGIEDLLPSLMQACEALQHAHGKDVVHGNLRPGKIVRLKDGTVKVIDFGGANVKASSSKSGVAAAALHYMSPEHAAGKADARSDQYALGAVLYELLALKPPFPGDDAKQLLEQVKTGKPAALLQLDPDLPADLVKVVEKAMSKTPGERYPDLMAMRADLEAAHKRIVEEAGKVREKLGGLATELAKLEADVGKRLGVAATAAAAAVIEAPKHLVGMLKHARKSQTRIEELRTTAAKLDKAEPAFKAGSELLAGAKFAEAIKEFESVLAQLPDYAPAKTGIENARKAEEKDRNQKAARKGLDDARKALESKDPERCLALVDRVTELPGSSSLEGEVNTLRKEAAALKTELEAKRLARQLAERARATVVDAKLPAESQGAAKHALALWNTAGEKVAEGNKLFSAEKYAEAQAAFEASAKGYQNAAEEARKAMERERRAAEEAENARRAKVANEILAEARKSLADRAYSKSQDAIRRAMQVPPPEALKAEVQKLKEEVDAAQQTELRAKKPSQTARLLMTETRASALAEGAEGRKTPAWIEAEAKAAEGTEAFEREHFLDAHARFEAAVVAYQSALEDARAAKQREKEEADKARQKADTEGRLQLATRLIGEAREAMGRGDHALCLDVLEAAARVSPTPEAQKEIATLKTQAENARKEKATADEATAVTDRERQKTERARDLVIEAVRVLHGQNAPETASKLWDEVEAKVGEAHAAFGKANYPAAFTAYEAGLALCQRFEDELRAAQKRDGEAAALKAVADKAAAEKAAGDKASAEKAAADKTAAGNAAAAKTAADKAAADKAAADKAAADKAKQAATAAPAKQASPAVAQAKGGATAATIVAGAGAAATASAASAAATAAKPKVADDPRDRKAPSAGPKAGPETVAEESGGLFSPLMILGVLALASGIAYMFVQLESQIAETPPPAVESSAGSGEAPSAPAAAPDAAAVASAKAAAAAQAAGEAKAAAEAKAAQDARAQAEAKLAADTKAASDAQAAAQAAAEAESTADAKTAADAKLAAETKAAAEAKAAADAKTAEEAKKLADAKTAEEAKKLADAKAAEEAKTAADAKAAETAAGAAAAAGVKAYASVFNEPTDSKHSGGAWGACWRADLAAAQACAKASCDRTRSSDKACSESASAEPGGHCAVASAAGFGVSWGACSSSQEGAEGAAISGCRAQANRAYPGENAACRIAWSSTPK